MSNLFWLMDEQIERLRPFLPKSHGRPRVDDWRVLSGIVFVNRAGCAGEMHPATTARTTRCTTAGSVGGRSGRVHADDGGLAGVGAERKTVMIDATYL